MHISLSVQKRKFVGADLTKDEKTKSYYGFFISHFCNQHDSLLLLLVCVINFPCVHKVRPSDVVCRYQTWIIQEPDTRFGWPVYLSPTPRRRLSRRFLFDTHDGWLSKRAFPLQRKRLDSLNYSHILFSLSPHSFVL